MKGLTNILVVVFVTVGNVFAQSMQPSFKGFAPYVPEMKISLPDTNNLSANHPNKNIVAVNVNTNFLLSEVGYKDTIGAYQVFFLKLKAEAAKALSFYSASLFNVAGGMLFVYNNRLSYESYFIDELEVLVTKPVSTPMVCIEYWVPLASGFKDLKIDEIGFFLKDFKDGEGSSGDCQIDVNCAEGTNWQNEKRGVVKLLLKDGAVSTTCSGAMVNNTVRDCKPYLLTAEHCIENMTRLELLQSQVDFNFENSNCAENDAESNLLRGLKFLASENANQGADFALLELVEPIPENYNVFYNGWDKTNGSVSSGVSIHHPKGDTKKIATFENPLTTDFSIGRDYWEVQWTATENGHGVTEPGSSGAPLFNEQKLIVGMLSGGEASCARVTAPDYYGRIAKSWAPSIDSSARLDVWLDPLALGVDFLSGSFFPCSDTVIATNYKTKTTLLGNPAVGYLNLEIEQEDPKSVLIQLLNISGQLIAQWEAPQSNKINTSYSLAAFSSGVYFVSVQIGNQREQFKVIVKH